MAAECKNINRSGSHLSNVAQSNLTSFCCKDASGQIVCSNGPAQNFESDPASDDFKFIVGGLIAGAIGVGVGSLILASFYRGRVGPPPARDIKPPEIKTARKVMVDTLARAEQLYDEAEAVYKNLGATPQRGENYEAVRALYIRVVGPCTQALEDIQNARKANEISEAEAANQLIRVRIILLDIALRKLGNFREAQVQSLAISEIYSSHPSEIPGRETHAEAYRQDASWAVVGANIAKRLSTEIWFLDLPQRAQIITINTITDNTRMHYASMRNEAADEVRVKQDLELFMDRKIAEFRIHCMEASAREAEVRVRELFGQEGSEAKIRRLKLKALSLYEGVIDGRNPMYPSHHVQITDAFRGAAEAAECLGLYARAWAYYRHFPDYEPRSAVMYVGMMATSELNREQWFKELTTEHKQQILEAIVLNARRALASAKTGVTPDLRHHYTASGINTILGQSDLRDIVHEHRIEDDSLDFREPQILSAIEMMEGGRFEDATRQLNGMAEIALPLGDYRRAVAIYEAMLIAQERLYAQATTPEQKAQITASADRLTARLASLYKELGNGRMALMTYGRTQSFDHRDSAIQHLRLAQNLFEYLTDVPEFLELGTLEQIDIALRASHLYIEDETHLKRVLGENEFARIRPDRIHYVLSRLEMTAAQRLALAPELIPYARIASPAVEKPAAAENTAGEIKAADGIAETSRATDATGATTVRGAEGKVDGAPDVRREGEPEKSERGKAEELSGRCKGK